MILLPFPPPLHPAAALSSRYVAQDNIMPLPGERILHRSLNHYFSGHSAALGRYIPTPKLQYEVGEGTAWLAAWLAGGCDCN